MSLYLNLKGKINELDKLNEYENILLEHKTRIEKIRKRR